jgi:peptidoglycan/xylan/chitin deacetylase (PgdA/CDA1 family)
MVPPLVGREGWDRLADRSDEPVERFLDLCDQSGSRATFFVVGEYARRFPGRIAAIAARGHEIGCHSMYHDDLALQPLSQFQEETRVAKEILEQASGVAVTTFRAPSFSVPRNHLREFYEVLADLGFLLDSSLTSAARIYGGAAALGAVGRVFDLYPLAGVSLTEVGVPGVRVFGREWTVFGGGYLRLVPTRLALAALRSSPYHVLYLHAHDFDVHCPRVPGASLAQHLRRRLRVGDLYARVDALLQVNRGRTCTDAARASSPSSQEVR